MVDERIGGWKSQGDRPVGSAESARSRQRRVVKRRVIKVEEEKSRHSDALLGRVTMKTLGVYHVVNSDGHWVCKSSSMLRKNLERPEADASSIPHYRRRVREIRALDPVAVGDIVRFIDNEDNTGLVVKVEPRRNKLTRRASGTRPMEQVIAANVDLVLPVMSVSHPDPRWNVLDRYLASAEASGLRAVIVLNKMDLNPSESVVAEIDAFERIGYPVIRCSTKNGTGISELREMLADRTVVLMGKSGVGKSSLLNVLDSSLALRVQDVGEKSGKGKHTTTSLTMYTLSSGTFVIDTPGMREFGLWRVGRDDRAALFPELREYISLCRFTHCSHDSEPGCAIKQAVLDGACSERRYRSLLRLMETEEENCN